MGFARYASKHAASLLITINFVSWYIYMLFVICLFVWWISYGYPPVEMPPRVPPALFVSHLRFFAASAQSCRRWRWSSCASCAFSGFVSRSSAFFSVSMPLVSSLVLLSVHRLSLFPLCLSLSFSLSSPLAPPPVCLWWQMHLLHAEGRVLLFASSTFLSLGSNRSLCSLPRIFVASKPLPICRCTK